MNRRCFFFVATIFSFVFSFNLFSQSPTTEQIHTSQLVKFYEMQDFEGGYEYGRKISEKFANNSELQAWFLLNMARNGMANEASEIAKKISEKSPDDVWANFAYAHALIRKGKPKDALPIAEKAYKLLPKNDSVILLIAEALAEAEKYDEALNIVEKGIAGSTAKSMFLVQKGEILYYKSKKLKDKRAEDLKRECFDLFKQAQALSPKYVNGFYFAGIYLNREKRFSEARKVLEQAIILSPRSISTRKELWKSLREGKRDGLTIATQNALIAAVDTFRKAGNPTSGVLLAIRDAYRDAGMKKEMVAAEKALFARFPNSREAEVLAMDRVYRASYTDKAGKIIERDRLEAIKAFRYFIKRPKHYDNKKLGYAYLKLFTAIRDDKSVSNQQFLDIAENSVKYEESNVSEFYTKIVYGLITRNMLAEAENFARRGVIATEKSFEVVSGEDSESRKYHEKYYRNAILGALGDVLSRQKKYDEAEPLLIKSEFFGVLGDLYVAQNKYDKAEDAYVNQLVNAYEKEGAWKAVKKFYEKKNGNADGYEQYAEKIKVVEASKRREKLLAEKEKEPRLLKKFDLKDYSGKEFVFENVKGKVVVINMWGTWCGPCVKEMPEFQELHKKFASDKDVAIITIALDQIDDVKKFMAEKKYDFPVLMGDEFLDEIGIDAYPTTWFVDRSGNISFSVIGSTNRLLEEFTWRIEELKKP